MCFENSLFRIWNLWFAEEKLRILRNRLHRFAMCVLLDTALSRIVFPVLPNLVCARCILLALQNVFLVDVYLLWAHFVVRESRVSACRASVSLHRQCCVLRFTECDTIVPTMLVFYLPTLCYSTLASSSKACFSTRSACFSMRNVMQQRFIALRGCKFAVRVWACWTLCN